MAGPESQQSHREVLRGTEERLYSNRVECISEVHKLNHKTTLTNVEDVPASRYRKVSASKLDVSWRAVPYQSGAFHGINVIN